MMKLPIYLDYMATTPLDPRVMEKMVACLDMFGNPASSHIYGWQAKEAIEEARQSVAALINADPQEIIWTSGATESINLAIKGAMRFYYRKGKHLITTKIEHKATLDTCQYLASQGYEVTYLDVDSRGFLNLEQLQNAIREDTVLVSLSHVNNEIGIIQNLDDILEITQKRGILLHIDAAQSAGKIPIDVRMIPIDLMSFSSHKVYGPKGIGALYLRRKPRVRLEPLLHGGGQESGLRSGTLATHQIVGMGEAFRIAKIEMRTESKRLLGLRERLWEGIKQMEGVYLNGDVIKRISGNLNVSFEHVEGESLLLSLNDLAVSSGAACTSATIEPSHVLKAMGCKDHLAHSSIRFSLGRFTTEEEIDKALQTVIVAVNRLREMSPLWEKC